MVYGVNQKNKAIDELLDKCYQAEEKGVSSYPGMTYEQGIKDAIDWITTAGSESPLADVAADEEEEEE